MNSIEQAQSPTASNDFNCPRKVKFDYPAMFLVSCLSLAFVPSALSQTIIYVDDTAAGLNNGTSWTNAYTDLQEALDDASELIGSVEIRIAEGNYRPSLAGPSIQPGNPRSVTFVMLNNVLLVGGFAGVESVNPDERDIALHKTVLSGDLNGDDAPNWSNRSDNAFHVLYSFQLNETAVLDGLVISGGHANGQNWPDSSGGGLLILDTGLTVRDCLFTDNWALGSGGAVARAIVTYFPGSEQFSFERTRFVGNVAAHGGGFSGEYFGGNFIDCRFERNQASHGGALFQVAIENRLSISNCTFYNNAAYNDGGAVYASLLETGSLAVTDGSLERNSGFSGGGLFVLGGEVVLERNEFFANSAEFSGGGIRADNVSTTIDNCMFQENDAPFGGGALLYSHAKIRNCSFEENTAEYRGGGLFTSQQGTAVVEHCSFIDNNCMEEGGGHYSGGPLSIKRCKYLGNSAEQGGALFTRSPKLEVSDTQFSFNFAVEGGAIADNSEGEPAFIEQSSFARNKATFGGAIAWTRSDNGLILMNCLFAQNEADSYGGAFAGGGTSLQVNGCTVANNTAGHLGGGFLLAANSAIENAVFWGNIVEPYPEHRTDMFAQIEALHFADTRYSIVQEWTGEFGGIGNSSDDPHFLNPQYSSWSSGVNGDYHLKRDSPAINAGDRDFASEPGESDLDGHARVLCGRVDMGAYEFGIGDVNCDRAVDLGDFAAWPPCSLGATPLPTECVSLDLDNDGDVDLSDFAALQRMGWSQ